MLVWKSPFSGEEAGKVTPARYIVITNEEETINFTVHALVRWTRGDSNGKTAKNNFSSTDSTQPIAHLPPYSLLCRADRRHRPKGGAISVTLIVSLFSHSHSPSRSRAQSVGSKCSWAACQVIVQVRMHAGWLLRLLLLLQCMRSDCE